MRLTEYLRVVRRHWLLILIVTVVCIGASVASGLLRQPVYQATAKNFVSVRSATNVSDLGQGSSYAIQVVGSYVDVATTPVVLEPVIQRLNLGLSADELASELSITTPYNSVIIQVTATDASPERAADIANAVSDSLATTVVSLTPDTSGSEPAVKVSTLATATAPTRSTSPGFANQALLGIIIGLVLGFALGVLIETVDTRLRSKEEAARIARLPVLGSIPDDPSLAESPLVVQLAPFSLSAEAFRGLRTNLFLVSTARTKVLVVGSPDSGEGKTTTAANLAIAIASTGRRVVLVDADLRVSRLSAVMGLESNRGLADAVIGEVPVSDALHPWGVGRLSVLPSGTAIINPSELLQSTAMVDVIETLRMDFDHIVIDTPPLLSVSDGLILSGLADATLVVAAVGRTRRPRLKRTVEALAEVHASVLGVVLTSTKNRADAAYHGNRPEHASSAFPIPSNLPAELER